MGTRERKEARIEKREQWAESRDTKAEASFAKVHAIADNIPFGQPILVGHHSEKRARKDQERIHSGMRAGIDSEKMAEHHRTVAGGIQDQLDRSIYSDDDNAIEAREQRIVDLEAERTHMRDINKAIKAFEKRTKTANADLTAADLAECGCTTKDVAKMWPELYGWRFPPYALQNLGGNITRNRKRLEEVKVRTQRAVMAEDVGGVLIQGTGEYVRLTFAEKPDRATINEIKEAGFCWGGGSWTGRRDRLPECVLETSLS